MSLSNESSINELTALVQAFCEARDWDQYHNPKDLAIGISTEANELLDHFRFKSDADMKRIMTDSVKRAPIEEELADVLYFVLRFAQMNGIDLGQALENKVRIDGEKYPADIVRGRNEKYNEYETNIG